MKGRSSSLSIVFFLWGFTGVVFASSGGVPQKEIGGYQQEKGVVKEEKTQKPSSFSQEVKRKEKTKPLKAEPLLDKEAKKRNELIRNKKVFLNNSRWSIEVMPLKGGRKSSDYIIFKDLKIGIESLLDKGFSYTNYTLSLKDNGSMVIETMQTSSKGRVVFIRAEISSDGKSLRGVMSFPEGATPEDYSFFSKAKELLR